MAYRCFSSTLSLSVLLMISSYPSLLPVSAQPAGAPAIAPTAGSSSASPMAAPTAAATPPAAPAATPAAAGPSASGGSAQVCPLTGKAPEVPTGPLARCTADNDLSCCTVCQDAGAALDLLSSNGSFVFGFLQALPIPSLQLVLSSILSKVVQEPLCKLFENNQACLASIQALYCGIACDPGAARYFKFSNGNGNLTLCSDFLTNLFTNCGAISIPVINQPINQLQPLQNPVSFFNAMVSPILGAIVPGLKSITATATSATENLTNCFSAPNDNSSSVTVCCDPLSGVPSQCLTPGNQGLVNRTLPSYCPAPEPPGSVSGETMPPPPSAGAVELFSNPALLHVLGLVTAIFFA